MKISDKNYALDPGGNRVLIGLSVDETNEFFRLERAIAKAKSIVPIASDEWHTPDEQRWLELYEKHQAALQPFLNSSKTLH